MRFYKDDIQSTSTQELCANLRSKFQSIVLQEEAADRLERMQSVLSEIAKGRVDCGRPLAAENARQIARNVVDWWESDHDGSPPATLLISCGESEPPVR